METTLGRAKSRSHHSTDTSHKNSEERRPTQPYENVFTDCASLSRSAVRPFLSAMLWDVLYQLSLLRDVLLIRHHYPPRAHHRHLLLRHLCRSLRNPVNSS